MLTSKSIKVSIITVCYNSAATLLDTLQSIQQQTYPEIEHIIIDGASTDNSVAIIKQYAPTARLLSEADHGIYDAMNKGFQLATGDVIGFLNADDIFAHSHAVETIVSGFESTQADLVYADLIYFTRGINQANTVPEKTVQENAEQEKIVRYFKSSPFQKGLFAKGWCPPHPTFYIKRTLYQQYGGFDLSLPMGNDVAFMMKLLEKEQTKAHHIAKVLVKMRIGGVSNQSWRNIWIQNKAILSAAKKMQIPIAPLPFLFYKLIDRLSQFFLKPNSSNL